MASVTVHPVTATIVGTPAVQLYPVTYATVVQGVAAARVGDTVTVSLKVVE